MYIPTIYLLHKLNRFKISDDFSTFISIFYKSSVLLYMFFIDFFYNYCIMSKKNSVLVNRTLIYLFDFKHP